MSVRTHKGTYTAPAPGTTIAELVGRGVEVTPVRHLDKGVWKEGKGEPWNSFIFFNDPDGNNWVIQEKPE